MKFKINHIEYETEETNIKLIEFLKNNKLSFINNNLLKVEIENNEQTRKRYLEYAFIGTIYQSKDSGRSIRSFIRSSKPFTKGTYQS